MTNEKKRKQYPKATIVLDKLIFSCVSTVEDNFDYVVTHNSEYYYCDDFQFGNTKLKRTIDPSNRYKHSYKVYYKKYLIGIINFALYYGSIYTGKLKFSVYNEVFYNDTLKYIPSILNDLNLSINNFKEIDIAMDSYKVDFEKTIRQNLKNKDNTVKLIGSIRYDRKKIIDEITYWHKGSLDNQFEIRTILVKKKKKDTSELCCYDKGKDIANISGKEYILKFHKEKNPKCKNIYRAEIRFKYEEIRRYCQKIKRPITFEDILNPQFLVDFYFENLDSLIMIFKGTGKKKTKIQLINKPQILPSEGILQPTLSDAILLPQQSENEANNIINFDNIKNSIINEYINQYKEIKYKHEIFINKINNNINKYITYNNT